VKDGTSPDVAGALQLLISEGVLQLGGDGTVTTTAGLSPETKARPEIQRLLGPEEVAAILGVPVATLYHWRYSGRGPRARKIGRHLRWIEAEVRGWLDEQR
jgi:predicted DNA-binding transcriptional regulator AlpA